MEFDHDNVRQVVEEDRLSSLPDELLHKILSSFDMKFAVQTSVLSSRWDFVWTSMPFLNFSSGQFGNFPKFANFVAKVLSHRNYQIEVSSIKLDFDGAVDKVFVRKIANYTYSHNLQELTVSCRPTYYHVFPPRLFSSQSLKHFTLSNNHSFFCTYSPCVTPKTPWDFPALTTLHLSNITLSDDRSGQSPDLFSKCISLRNLTLESFTVGLVKVFDIITPQLSNLTLIKGSATVVINLITPQLEHLTIINSSIDYLNGPQGVSSLCYKGYLPRKLCKGGFHSLNKVSISLNMYRSYKPYMEEEARKTISMLQELHSVRYLTLNVDIVECISSFPDLLSHHPSPFSNLICLTIDSSKRSDAYNVKISTEARNFFLENSPNATFIMELPEAPPTKTMKQKEAKAKRAKQIESQMTEFQALIKDHENMAVKRKWAKEKAKVALDNILAEVSAELRKGHTETQRLVSQFKICLEEMRGLVKEEKAQVEAIVSKEAQIRSLLENMPKGERTEVESRYSRHLEEAEQQRSRLLTEIVDTERIFAFEKLVSHFVSTYQDVFCSKLPLASQMPSSSSKTGSFCNHI